MAKDISALLVERNRLAQELRLTRHDMHGLQHRIDALTAAISKMSAMPSIVEDVIGGDVFGALGGFGRRRRKRIIP